MPRLILAVLLILAANVAPAAAQQITITDAKSQPVFDYNAATRERVYIPQPGIDQDNDLMTDDIAIEIIRPKQSGPDLKVPAIIDPSPYYTTVCRGNEAQCIGDTDNDGLNDKWPLFLGKYFVPRGYAYILAESNGTANSSGCPLHGGAGDVAGEKSVVDWLNGRVKGYTKPQKGGTEVIATWHNGKAAMIGKSYDGTLANGVAATGVDGLTTIVPISAISSWYEYSRMGGIRFNAGYPATLSTNVTDNDRKPICAPTLAEMTAASDDANGDYNSFWDERNYLKDVSKVKAAVFAVHGLQDDNVRMNHLQPWWDGLKQAGVPRKLWLIREGHVDPFDSRRAVWVDTLQRWFDHWLLGVDNGIMGEPRVTIEDAKDTFNDYAEWPLPGTEETPVFLRGVQSGEAGALGLSTGGATASLAFTDAPTQSEAQMMNDPGGSQASRLVFLSNPLTKPLRLSGTPKVNMMASLNTAQSNLGALLVDYGPSTQITRSGEGVANLTTRTCWGQKPTSTADFSECYLEVRKPTVEVTAWRMTRGILDSSNRTSLTTPSPATPGTKYAFNWPLMPNDYVVPEGHQFGVVLVGNYFAYGTSGAGSATPDSTITVDTKLSSVSLPIVGGYPAAVASRAFAADVTAPALSVSPDVVTDATSADGAVVDYAAPSVTDDEDPRPTATCDPASGTLFPVGMTTVACVGSDASGNTMRKTFTVTVRPQPAPSPDLTNAPTTPAPDPTASPSPMPAPAKPAATDTTTAAPVPVTTGTQNATPSRPAPTLDTPGRAAVTLRVRHRGHRILARLKTSTAVTVRLVVRRKGQPVKRITRRVGPGVGRLLVRSPKVKRGRSYVVVARVRDASGNVTRLRRRA